MNDKAFDKHFREELNEEIKYPFDDKLWDNLSQRLDDHNKGSSVLGSTLLPKAGSGFRNLYWLAPLFLLLLGTNAWYMWNAHNAQQDNEHLKGEMQSLKTILEKRDTVVKTQIIYKTDTLYIDRKILDSEKKISNTNKPNFLDAERGPSVPKVFGMSLDSIFLTQKSSKTPFESITNKINPASIPTENPKTDLLNPFQKPTQSIDNQLIKNNENSNTNKQNDIVALDNKEETKAEIGYKSVANKIAATDKLPLLMSSVLALPTVQKQNILSALNEMPIQKPVPFKRFYVGLTGSWLNYQTAWVNAAGIEVFRNEKGYQVGLRMEYAFNENWRLMLGSDYCPFDVNISWKDKRYNLPDIPQAYQASHKMKSVEAREPLLNGFVGAKYVFNGLGAKPYLGLAYSAMKILPYVATYHMQNLWTQADADVEVSHSGQTISNLMMLTGGYEFKLGGRFVAQTEAFYYKDLNKEQKMFDLFGVRATVLARF